MPPLALVIAAILAVQDTPPPVTADDAPATPATPAATPAVPEGIGTMVYVNGEAVTDYRPETTLVLPETDVPFARFPAFDVHCHWSIEEDPYTLLAAMDKRNVIAAVNLSGGFGGDLEDMLRKYARVAPRRLLVFANIDWSRIDDPDFSVATARDLARAAALGAAGLKIFKNLGLTIRDGDGEIVAIDDPRLDAIWAACGKLRLPVLIHTADPAAFFAPIDGTNERWMQLRRHPTWSFHGPEFPTREELFAQRDRVLARHRETIFIGAHVGSHAGDLRRASHTLKENPNFFVDISGRVGELGRQPFAARRFLIEHQDKVLFGTDRFPGRPDQPRYRIYYRFLETDDEYFEYYHHPFAPAGDWRIYGVDLPDEVLRKIYLANARYIFDRR